jgi:hypothetical protein
MFHLLEKGAEKWQQLNVDMNRVCGFAPSLTGAYVTEPQNSKMRADHDRVPNWNRDARLDVRRIKYNENGTGGNGEDGAAELPQMPKIAKKSKLNGGGAMESFTPSGRPRLAAAGCLRRGSSSRSLRRAEALLRPVNLGIHSICQYSKGAAEAALSMSNFPFSAF